MLLKSGEGGGGMCGTIVVLIAPRLTLLPDGLLDRLLGLEEEAPLDVGRDVEWADSGLDGTRFAILSGRKDQGL